MRKSDIRTGVIYGYRRNKWASLRPLVLLSTEKMRRSPDGAAASGVLFTPAGSGPAFDSDGYAVVIGPLRADGATLEKMRQLTLENVTSWPLPQFEGQLTMACTLLTRLNSVLDPFEKILDAERRAANEKAEKERLRNEGFRTRLHRRDAARDRLRALGISVSSPLMVYEESLTLPVAEAEALAERLEALTSGSFDTPRKV